MRILCGDRDGISIVDSSGPWGSTQHNHDANGHKVQDLWTLNGQTHSSWTYGYDDLDRLLSATNTGNGSLSQTFTYDAAHNMTSNNQVGTYTYPA